MNYISYESEGGFSEEPHIYIFILPLFIVLIIGWKENNNSKQNGIANREQ